MAGFATGGLQGFLSQWIISPSPSAPDAQSGPWRPPGWGQQPQLTLITVPPLPASGSDANNPVPGSEGGVIGVPPGTSAAQASTNYFFDAVFRVEHDAELRYTQHPVQTGAAICDHAYLMPSKVTLEIGMSDVMDSFVSDQYSGDASKSVAAYQKFRDIQKACLPITVTTRLYTYSNMLIAFIRTTDDRTTRFGLKAAITFAQIIPAKISATTVSVPASARPQDTVESPASQKLGDPPSQAVTENNQVPRPALYETSTTGPLNVGEIGNNVPGAGNWSSNSVNGFPVGGGTAF